MGILKIGTQTKDIVQRIINKDSSYIYEFDTTTLINKIVVSGEIILHLLDPADLA